MGTHGATSGPRRDKATRRLREVESHDDLMALVCKEASPRKGDRIGGIREGESPATSKGRAARLSTRRSRHTFDANLRKHRVRRTSVCMAIDDKAPLAYWFEECQATGLLVEPQQCAQHETSLQLELWTSLSHRCRSLPCVKARGTCFQLISAGFQTWSRGCFRSASSKLWMQVGCSQLGGTWH